MFLYVHQFRVLCLLFCFCLYNSGSSFALVRFHYVLAGPLQAADAERKSKF